MPQDEPQTLVTCRHILLKSKTLDLPKTFKPVDIKLTDFFFKIQLTRLSSYRPTPDLLTVRTALVFQTSASNSKHTKTII